MARMEGQVAASRVMVERRPQKDMVLNSVEACTGIQEKMESVAGHGDDKVTYNVRWNSGVMTHTITIMDDAGEGDGDKVDSVNDVSL